MTKYPPIQVVDENDNPIRGASMDEIHRNGLLHRVTSVIVRDPEGRVLLQKRTPNVAINPSTWDISAGGHVDEGESYLVAATRELHEELGLDNLELRQVAYFKTRSTYEWRQLYRFNTVFLVEVPADTEFSPHPEEVTELKWFTPDELREVASTKEGAIINDYLKILDSLDEDHQH